MHPGPVIARNEAIHRCSHEDMDCHGAARLAMTDLDARLAMTDLTVGLAMTEGAVVAPRFCHCAPRLVIARNEAIHRPSHNGVDCHGAGRLAMTDLTARLAMTDLAARLKMTQR